MASISKEVPSEQPRVKRTPHDLVSRQLSQAEFQTLANGIDTRYPPKREPHRNVGYEDACFTEITKRDSEPNSFFIGPHFIDMFLVNRFSDEQRLSFPDAIRFNIDSHEKWVLKDLYEFRSGNDIHSSSKLEGFSKLLARMRDKNELPDLFQKTLIPDALKTIFTSFPKDVVIPPDNEISVTFASKCLQGGLIYDAKNRYKTINHICVRPGTDTKTK